MHDIPPELLTSIVEQLYQDYGNQQRKLARKSPLDLDPLLANLRSVRLVCKAFCAAASKLFGETYFKHRTIVLQEKSLKSFVKLSRSARLRQHLRSLDISAYRFLPQICKSLDVFTSRVEVEKKRQVMDCQDRPYVYLNHCEVRDKFNPINIMRAYSKYQQYLKRQRNSDSAGKYTRLLGEAFKNVQSLLSILVIGIDFNDPRYILKDVGISLLGIEYSEVEQILSSVFQAMVYSRIKVCNFGLRGLSRSALELPKSDFKAFKRITTSHLHSLDFVFRTCPFHPSNGYDDYDIFRLIKAVPLLQSLTLSFISAHDSIMGGVILDRLFNNATIEHLKTLELCGVETTYDELSDFLLHHSDTLRHLRFINFNLITPYEGWKKLFGTLHDCLELHELFFHNIFDVEEAFHLPSESLQDYVCGRADTVDWDSIERLRRDGDDENSSVFDDLIFLAGVEASMAMGTARTLPAYESDVDFESDYSHHPTEDELNDGDTDMPNLTPVVEDNVD